MKTGLRKSVMAWLGIVMLVGGLLLAGAAVCMETTIAHSYNIGLIGRQEAETTLWSAVAIAGAVLLGAAGAIEAVQVHGRRVTELHEKASQDRREIMRRLDALGEGQAAAAPPRSNGGKLHTDFDR